MSGLVCNNIMCRTPLGDTKVYVTFCSHIFCSRCGDMVAENFTCGACRTDLNGEWKVVQVQQEPGEEWKALVLAGLHPTTILEVATKALAFHYRQVQMEAKYVKDKMKRASKRLDDVKKYYEEVVDLMKQRVNELEMNIEQMEEKMNEQSAPTDDRNAGFSLDMGSRSSHTGSGSTFGLSVGRGTGSSFGLSCYFGRGSRLTSSYLGNRLGGGNVRMGGGGNVRMGGGGNVRMAGGGNDAPLVRTYNAARRYTDAESLASVIRSVPIARITGRPREGNFF